MLRLVFFLVVSGALAWAAVWVVNHPGTVVVQWLDQELILSVGTVIAAVIAFAAPGHRPVRAAASCSGLPSRWRARAAGAAGARLRGADARPDGGGGRRPQRRAHHHRQAERYLPDNGSCCCSRRRPPSSRARRRWRTSSSARCSTGATPSSSACAACWPDHEDRRVRRGADPGAPGLPPQPDHALGAHHPVRAAGPRREVGRGAAAGRRDAGAEAARRRQARHKRRVSCTLLATACASRTGRRGADAGAARRSRQHRASRRRRCWPAELAMQFGRRRLALQVLEDAGGPSRIPTSRGPTPSSIPTRRRRSACSGSTPAWRRSTGPPGDPGAAGRARHAGRRLGHRAQPARGGARRQPTARVYRLLAELERQAGGDNAKAQEWLAKATDAEPDRAWVCDDTGEVLPAWQPLAPSGRFDAVHWSTPPKVATMLGAEQTTYILPRDDARPGGQPPRPRRCRELRRSSRAAR